MDWRKRIEETFDIVELPSGAILLKSKETGHWFLLDLQSSKPVTLYLGKEKITKTANEWVTVLATNPERIGWIKRWGAADERTANYLQLQAQNLGVLSIIPVEDNSSAIVSPAIEYVHKVALNPRAGQDIQGHWVLEVDRKKEGKIVKVRWYLERPLSQEEVENFFLLVRTYFSFLNFSVRPILPCWYCGGFFHWLDVPLSEETIPARVEIFSKPNCGCTK